MEYDSWIKEHVAEAYGNCADVTLEMQKAFPELTRIRGHYYCAIWGGKGRTHWWLTDSNGVIVDPTKDQFPSRGLGVYIPWIEGDPEPTGLCPNCGGYTFNGDSVCGDVCSQAYLAYLNGV